MGMSGCSSDLSENRKVTSVNSSVMLGYNSARSDCNLVRLGCNLVRLGNRKGW